jgi:hypothetical protein
VAIPSPELCIAYADEIEDSFARYGCRINPTSDIGNFVREMRWLAAHLEMPRASLTTSEQNRFAEAFLRAEQAGYVADALRYLREVSIPPEKLKLLTERLDRLNTKDDPKAQDTLFEFVIAGRLARHSGCLVSFEEPDLIITRDGRAYGLACKRVKSINKLDKRISEGAGQGVRSNMPCFVVVAVEYLTPAATLVLAKSREELSRCAEAMVERLSLQCLGGAQRAFAKGACGVILCGRFVAVISEQLGKADEIRWSVRYKGIPNLSIPGAGSDTFALIDVMK